jgi:hypothetical protein
VTLNVGSGPNKQKFSVHKELLGRKSPALKAAFDGRFKEGHTNEMELPEDDPEAFSLLVSWLYTNRIPRQRANPEDTTAATALYFRLFVLADKHLIPDLEESCYVAIKSLLGTMIMPDLMFLEELFATEMASPRLKFYIANVCAHFMLQAKETVNKSFEEFLESHSKFAAYLCRVVAWRMRLGPETRIVRLHPTSLGCFFNYFVTGIKGDEFEVAEKIEKKFEDKLDALKVKMKARLSHG